MISHLDHFVLTVASIERTCAFYEGVLGMKVNSQKAEAITPALERRAVG
jgi:catechol 2,3-dioxygenase-like lactoylglutathione lyase family enzyme